MRSPAPLPPPFNRRSIAGTAFAQPDRVGACSAVWMATALWIGLAAGQQTGSFWGWAGAGAALPSVWLARRAPDRIGTAVILIAVFAAGLARGAASRAELEAAAARLSPDRAPVWLGARVVDHPWREGDEPTAVVQVVRSNRLLPRGARVRLRLPPRTSAEWGDTLQILARLEPPPPRRVPGVSSARDAAWAQGVVGQGRGLHVEMAPAPSLARATVARWRRGLEARFARELSPATREIVTPLVTGDRSGLDPELGARFRASGLVHLLALSGLHVAWMATVARGIASAAGGGIAVRAWAGALCAVFYVGVAGPLPSLARAAATELLVALASLRGRVLDPLQALAMAAVVLLALAPAWAGDLGFQLSCAATLGLATLGRRVADSSTSRSRITALVLRALKPTAAAQVTALPIALERFHALPWTGLGANLLAVPTCDLLLAAAWLGAGLDALLPGAGRWCFAACELLSQALRAIAGTAAGSPLAMMPTGHSKWPVALASIGALLAVAVALAPRDLARTRHGPSRPRAACRWLAPLALALALFLGVTAPTLRPPPGRWWLVVLDVGQGDALAIGGSHGWWLVDTGPRSPGHDAGSSVVLPFLNWAAVRRLDAVVLTHDHGDHTGGARAVARALPITRWWIGTGAPRPRTAPGGAVIAQACDTIGRGPTMVARWPIAGFVSRDPNASSLTLEVGEGRGRALLAADVDSLVEARLGLDGALAALKVGHHGASSSSGTTFLARHRPRVAVISCGRHNPFGHPDPGAIARLEQVGASVRRTDRDGTVWLELGPEGAREIAWRDREIGDAPAVRPAPTSREAGGALAHAAARW